jgi:hypothetical protein
VSADYFQEIEAHFAMRRGTPFVVNPKDWALMQEWQAAGVPLPVVIEAIDSVFDKQEAKGKKVNGLRYCRHAVKELWDERRELQIGAESGVAEESPGPRLEALAAALQSFPDAAARIRAMVALKSVPRIEEALMELEAELVSALAADAPQLRAEAESLVAGSDEKTRARSLEAHLRRLVREHYGIPRLTLF